MGRSGQDGPPDVAMMADSQQHMGAGVRGDSFVGAHKEKCNSLKLFHGREQCVSGNSFRDIKDRYSTQMTAFVLC